MVGCTGSCGSRRLIPSTRTDKVIINSPETVKALEYCKALSDTSFRRRLVNDSSNNKHSSRASSIAPPTASRFYVAAKDDPTKKDLAEDTYLRADAGRPGWQADELQLAVPILAFNFTKYPNAAKAFIAFMLAWAEHWLLVGGPHRRRVIGVERGE